MVFHIFPPDYNKIKETAHEISQDHKFALVFFLISIFSIYRLRLYYDLKGHGKVITIFYILIFLCSTLRCIWFFIPSYSMELSYSPSPTIAYETNGWEGLLLSEVLLSLGTIALYGVFILISCYWYNMLLKINIEDNNLETHRRMKKRMGTLNMFFIVLFIILLIQSCNILLYTYQYYNSNQMLVIDSIIIVCISLISIVVITVLSKKIRHVLTIIAQIDTQSTQPQIRRINAMAVVANVFLAIRIIIEISFIIYTIIEIKKFNSFILSSFYWDNIIFIKHSTEVLILLLELVISTAIKTAVTMRSDRPRHNFPSHSLQSNQSMRYQSIPVRDSATIFTSPTTDYTHLNTSSPVPVIQFHVPQNKNYNSINNL